MVLAGVDTPRQASTNGDVGWPPQEQLRRSPSAESDGNCALVHSRLRRRPSIHVPHHCHAQGRGALAQAAGQARSSEVLGARWPKCIRNIHELIRNTKVRNAIEEMAFEETSCRYLHGKFRSKWLRGLVPFVTHLAFEDTLFSHPQWLRPILDVCKCMPCPLCKIQPKKVEELGLNKLWNGHYTV